MQRMIIVLAASLFAAGLASTSGRAARAAASCQDLDPSIQGSYRRPNDIGWSSVWTLTLRSCSFVARENDAFAGGGDYAVQNGNASAGAIEISNDRGCHDAGDQDLPTLYAYTFDGTALTLTAPAEDLCVGRGRDLGRTWLKVPDGGIRLVYDAGPARHSAGHFTMSGAGVDSGRVVLARSTDGKRVGGTLVGSNGSISFVETIRGTARTWRITGGTKLYKGLAGTGSERATLGRRGLHVVVTATIAGGAS